MDIARLATTQTFEHTISGLLRKRADLFNEAERIRDRLAEIKNDIGAIDRTLNVLGYSGDLDAQTPRQKREVIFGRGELSRAVRGVLRDAEQPLTSRQIAQEIVSLSGHDARDRRYVSDLTKRVGKALRSMENDGGVKRATDRHGNIVWSRY
ncbi:hypothetical protein [Afifella pfennigii]|uniref:hypothetical protein n=1 Tax=Afifella pfennigii TaxID=209897 RepID=UPI00054F989F|nr:hypothetical protein [Afifella pfennigii]